MLFLLFFILICNAKYNYKHTIKTNYTNKNKLIDAMSRSEYFKLYLNEVKAKKITFSPEITSDYLNDNSQIIKYICVPKITLLPINLPNLQITQKWNITNEVFMGNIKCSYIDFDIMLEFLEENELIDIIITSTINKKLAFIPNIALKYAIYDYENIYNKIIKKLL